MRHGKNSLEDATQSSASRGRGNTAGSRSNALWGKRGGRSAIALVSLAIALILPVAGIAAQAKPGPGGGPEARTAPGGEHGNQAFVPDSLLQAAQAGKDQSFKVIIQGDPNAKSRGLADKVARFAADPSAAGGAAQLAPDQIRREFQSIDGVQAVLTGKQILKLAKSKDVVAITPNIPVQTSAVFGPAEMKKANPAKWPAYVGAATAWTSTATPPTIAIVDSGVDSTRPEFAGRILTQVQVNTSATNSPGDSYGHGTFVASIAASAALGHYGLAPTAPIVSLDVMDSQGNGTIGDVIHAADWILQNKNTYNIRVANFSLHGSRPASVFFDPLDAAVEKLWLNGVVVVASAGNYRTTAAPSGVMFAPGNDPFVITVGAIDVSGRVSDTAPWSAYGFTPDGFMKPEIGAPGRYMIGSVPVNSTLYSQRPDHVVAPGYMELSGTSFAAPVVSAMAAELLAANPTWTPDQVKGELMLTGKKIGGPKGSASGVGVAVLPKALKVSSNPPNPNAGLDQFVTTDASGQSIFNAAAWESAAWGSAAWGSAAWAGAAWSDAAWSSAAWGSAAWSDAAWSTAAWSTAAWSDAAWADAAWSDAAWADSAAIDPAPDPALSNATDAELAAALADASFVANPVTGPRPPKLP